ncbi:hypothetical protein DB88DRAFT_537757 [Papiliotrema laurentii]|uniref:Uncharacterized protein n=1 Tax=Papiliotrema laurentii TaxID=5418 RepID=A0AAD9L9V1_PAPLA|nr:hypothetical protein DB88DRAFT_537757 [Papiliotrema laurentii]
MRWTILLPTLALLLPSLAYNHGEIPINVAVRSDGNGEIHHFYEKDRIEHERRRAAEQQLDDPELDRYPVKSDGNGIVVPFHSA